MINKKSIVQNYIYNLIYQIFLIVIPIITTPYVSRVLGVEGSGQYSYIFSIVSYFTIFASFGFAQYAQRLIARNQGNKYEQSKLFWEIVIARLLPAAVSLIVYVALLNQGIYSDKYYELVLIMSINVIAVMFDISFFFQGNEEFKEIISRSIIIKVICVVLIYIFVKNDGDLWKYALLQSLSIFLGYVVLWAYMPKRLVRVRAKDIKAFQHVLPALVLFLPVIASSVYVLLDKTMIGIITKNDSENGNYEYAERIVKIAMTVITSLGTVMIPRNAQQFAIGDTDGIKNNISNSLRFVFFLGVPITLGCVVVADNLIPWYLGSGYSKAADLMKILSPLILIIGLSNIFGLQILLPSGQDKKYALSIVCGAVINFMLNCVLIRLFASFGAAISTVVAEIVVTLVMYMNVREYIKWKDVSVSLWKYILSGGVMFLLCFALERNLKSSITNTLLIVTVGGITYVGILLMLKDEHLYSFLNLLVNKRK